MIDEHYFSRHYTSFWNDLLPRGEALVRRLNLQHERCLDPYHGRIPPSLRALANESAFRFFAAKASSADGLSDATRDQIFIQAVEYIEGLMRAKFDEEQKSDQAILEEALNIEGRITVFFKYKFKQSDHVISPSFSGCGILNACKGDIVCGNTLYELKAGDRDFRLIDVRQVVVYLALNKLYHSYTIQKVCLYNPRRGTETAMEVDELFDLSSGRTPTEVYDDIIAFLSSEALSR